MSNYSEKIEKEERTTQNIRICDLKEMYPDTEIEVYYGTLVLLLGEKDEPIHIYDEETKVEDYELMSADEWMIKFVGESTADVDWSTLVIVIAPKIDEQKMLEKMMEVAKDYELGPVQSKVYALREIGVTNVEIAKYLGKDERVTADAYANAKKNISSQDVRKKQAALNEEMRQSKDFVGKTVKELINSDGWDIIRVFRGKNIYDANRHSCDVEKHMDDLVVDYDTDCEVDDEGSYINMLYIII